MPSSAEIWRDVDADPEISVALLRGAGNAFSAGGDLALVESITRDFTTRARVWKEARDIVYNLINCTKPVVSAMEGRRSARGWSAGCWPTSRSRRKERGIIDGHTRLGVAAGDHAAIIWPLLCGMAKAKYYLLLCEHADRAQRPSASASSRSSWRTQARRQGGRDCCAARRRRAERDPLDQVRAEQLAAAAGPSFDASLALEFLGFSGPEVQEGMASLREKRRPDFPPSSPVLAPCTHKARRGAAADERAHARSRLERRV